MENEVRVIGRRVVRNFYPTTSEAWTAYLRICKMYDDLSKIGKLDRAVTVIRFNGSVACSKMEWGC